jgi:hypothetical protein
MNNYKQIIESMRKEVEKNVEILRKEIAGCKEKEETIIKLDSPDKTKNKQL